MTKVATVLLLAVCTGCASSMHRVVNTGDRMLYAVTVESDGTEFGHGYLPPGAGKGYHGAMGIKQSPPPVISWRTEERGPTISREAKLARKPWSWHKVVFEIDGENVTARLASK